MKKTDKAGFLLVEILVALGVVALVLGVLLQAFSHTFQNSVSAKHYQLASLLAEQKIWEGLWDDELTAGVASGSFEEHPGMEWETAVTLLYHPEEETEEAAPFAGSKDAREKLPPTDLYQIEVKIFWKERGKRRQFDLATYTLVPVPEQEGGEPRAANRI